MKEAIKARAERAEYDEILHEELAQAAVNFASAEDRMRENGHEEAADQASELIECMIEHSPNSVYQRATEIEAKRED